MASKRHIRKKMCGSKRRYTDKERAGFAAFMASKKTQSGISAYRCKFCGGYHIGHKPNGRKYRATSTNWKR